MPFKPRERLKPARKVDEFSLAEETAKADKPTEVEDGPELLRILELERREIPDPESPESVQLAQFLTRTLGKLPIEQLYPGPLTSTQALCIKSGKVHKGGFFPIVVGGGKMLAEFLTAALYLAAGYERIVYIIPADMEPTVAKEFPLYRQSWHGPSAAQLNIQTYERISHLNNAEELDAKGNLIKLGLLDRLRPQVLILDESHNASDTGAAVTKRIKHYMARHPDTIVLCFSGTPFKSSIKDVAHILEWCLKERSPLPRPGFFSELTAWAGYLDSKSGAFGRVGLGALRELALAYDYEPDIWIDDDEVKSEIQHRMRRIVAQRILETPGVIGTQDAPLDIPLTMEPWYPLTEHPDVTAAYEQLLLHHQTPDGVDVADDISSAVKLDTMGKSFWSKWLPAPPAEWMQARNTWAKWCRRGLRYNKHRVTSEATMKGAVRRGLYKSGQPILQAWEAQDALYREVTGLREPPSVPQWLGEGTEVVESVRAWVKEHNGLVWVQHIGLGQLLARELGIPYYGDGGGKDARTGNLIINHVGGAAIASLAACGTGKNLQRIWSNNLWLCVPGEQAMARTHRRGQPSPVVRNHYYLGCGQHLEAIERAREVKAAFAEDLMLSPQKLRYAEWLLPDYRELERRGGYRWSPTK